MKRKNIKKEGFTLVELIVAIGIFSIVSLAILSATFYIYGANRSARIMKSAVDNVNFAMEDMSRSLRTGYDYSCNVNRIPGTSCDANNGNSTIYFKNNFGINSSYSLSSNALIKTEGGETYTLTNSETQINLLKFYVSGAGLNDGNPPKIIIILNGRIPNKGTFEEFNLQTTLTQRKLDR